MSRLHIQIKTHSFTCASYNPFEVLHLGHIGPLRADVNGSMFILVIIDAFSRWVELYPTKTTTAAETASCIFQHFGRFGTPEVVHTDRVEELLRMSGTEQSLTTAYSGEENSIVERANQEVLRHLNAILFDSRSMTDGHDHGGEDVYGYHSSSTYFKQFHQSIKANTHVSAVLHIQDTTRPTGQIALSDRMDEWISKQTTLIKVAGE